jgi:hypothetical protein
VYRPPTGSSQGQPSQKSQPQNDRH